MFLIFIRWNHLTKTYKKRMAMRSKHTHSNFCGIVVQMFSRADSETNRDNVLNDLMA